MERAEHEYGMSERHACWLLGQWRGTQRYEPVHRLDEDELTQAIIALAANYGRYGYRRITALLRRAGWEVGKDRVQRIWRREGLKVPQKHRPRRRLWLNDGSCIRLRPERLPHTLAIHHGEAKNPGDKNNPHAHLMISERGGALKSRELMNPDWIAQTRQVWEQEANRALERAGRSERINHRSLAEQFTEAARSGDLERAAVLSREPSVHRGPQKRQADSTVKQRVGVT